MSFRRASDVHRLLPLTRLSACVQNLSGSFFTKELRFCLLACVELSEGRRLNIPFPGSEKRPSQLVLPA
jgi:hypothetical protein